jgi:hypothetical protein
MPSFLGGKAFQHHGYEQHLLSNAIEFEKPKIYGSHNFFCCIQIHKNAYRNFTGKCILNLETDQLLRDIRFKCFFKYLDNLLIYFRTWEEQLREVSFSGWACVMSQMVSCWPLSMEAWVQSQASPCGMTEVAMGQVFLQVLPFSPVIIIPPMLYAHSFI